MRSLLHLRRSLGLAVGALAIASAPAPAISVDRASVAASQRPADALRQAEQTRLQALVDADVAVAGRLIAGDFELINPLGEVLTRADLLGAVSSGAIDFLSDEASSPIRVRRHGNTAVLRYRHTVDIQVAGVGHLTHPAWSTALYERRNGRWQIVWEQTGAIGPLPLPS
jgi:Domain of unknown function (DUF4440)